MSAIEEFGRHGYEAASTNVIVNNAGASKGLLFHYYGNKRKLFLECTYYVLDRLTDYIMDNLELSDTDVFSRLKQALVLKLNFYKEYPTLIGMASKLWYSENRPEVEGRIAQYTSKYPGYSRDMLFKDVDMSRFKDDVDFNTMIGYVSLTLEAGWHRFNGKYNDDFKKAAENIDEYLAEIDTVLELMKRGAYRE